VGLLASDLPQNILPSDPQDAQRLMSQYAAQVQTLLKQGAQVVVAPKKIVVVQDENIKAVDDLFATPAAASGSQVVIGVARHSPREWLNEARIYAPANPRPLTYEKYHMLPPFESKFTVGNSRTVVCGGHHLQRYGFPRTEPRIRPRECGPAPGSGLGF